MNEKQIRRAKLTNYIAFGIVIILLLWAGFGIFRFATRPLAQNLTLEGLQAQVTEGTRVDGHLEDGRYEITCGPDFSGLFQWNCWEEAAPFVPRDPILTISMADEYDMEFYEGGLVCAFDGYAPSGVVGEAYYRIPEAVLTDLVSYFRQNATVQ